MEYDKDYYFLICMRSVLESLWRIDIRRVVGRKLMCARARPPIDETLKAYYWIEAEIIFKNINQDFYYMSCDLCNKKLMFYNDNEETDCENSNAEKDVFQHHVNTSSLN
ncbi:hypothetical protein F8388_001346 [Cannabis sativa]|uniref:Uncharacterized protein n=1 Tax=Cannabis sativa TaxID=3483 RepID=A0A7J6DY02_CANSA|nr:hypothetical protein F8388_001346 [Cannabis sativa]